MARTPQRGRRWSLRQVAIAADVSLATARGIANRGHLDVTHLGAIDVLVVRVAAAACTFGMHNEARPANEARVVPAREWAAVAAVRDQIEALSSASVLVITATTARLLGSPAEQAGTLLALAGDGQQFLCVPVGSWWYEIFSALPVSA